MQAAHHLAERRRAGAAVLVRVGGIGALGRRVVVRVVAPVEGVLVGDGGHGRLLLLRGGSRVGDDRLDLQAAVLLDGGDVEAGQEVHRVHAGVGQLGQGAHAVGVLEGERLVGAAELGRDGLVGDGEVADVELVDGAVGELVDDRRLVARPDLRGPLRVVEVDEHRVGGVQGEAHRVGVGHHVAGHRVERRDEHLHVELVGAVDPTGLAGDGPDARGTARHVDPGGLTRAGGIGVQQQADVLGGGCPELQRRRAVGEGHAELVGACGGRVQVVEHARDLQAGEDLGQVAVVLHDGEVALEGLLDGRAVRVERQLEEAAQVRPVEQVVGGEAGRVEGEVSDLDGAVAGDRAVDEAQPAVGGGPEFPGAGGAVPRHEVGGPGDGALVDPVPEQLPGAGQRRVLHGDLQQVGVDVVGEHYGLVGGRGELVVVTVERAADAVVLAPRQAVGDLDLVAARGQLVGGPGVGAVPVGEHEGDEALRLPVARAAHRGLEAAGERDDGALRGVEEPVRDRVVEEGHLRGRVERVGRIRTAGHAALAVVDVPTAADGDLVRVAARGQLPRAGVEAGGLVEGEGGLGALRLPVAGAAHGRIVAAGHGDGRGRVHLAGLDGGGGEVGAHHDGGGCGHLGAGGVGADRAHLEHGARGEVGEVGEDARLVGLGGAERGVGVIAEHAVGE